MKKEYIIQSILFILVILGIGYIFNFANTDNFDLIKKQTEEQIETSINSFKNIDKDINLNEIDYKTFEKLNKNLPFDLYIYENNKLLFWNNNQAIPEPHVIQTLIDQNIVFIGLDNGYYIAQKKIVGTKILLGLSLIRNSYNINNKYLTTKYSEKFPFNDKDILLPALHSSGESIHTPNGEVLFKVEHFKGDTKINNSKLFISIVVFAMLFLLIFQVTKYIKFKSNFTIGYLAIIFLGLLWYLSLDYIPYEFKKCIIFSPSLYGSTYFPSLGHVFTFALYLHVIGYITMIAIVKQLIKNTKKTAILLNVISSIIYIFVAIILKSLVLDSIILFTAKNLALLNKYSLFTLLIALFISTAYTLLSLAVAHLNRKIGNPYIHIIPFLKSILFVLIFLNLEFGIISYILALASFFFDIFLVYFKTTAKKTNTFLIVLVSLIFSVLMVSTIFIAYTNIKSKNNTISIAEQKARQRDINAEFLFEKIQNKIKSDSFVKNFFENPLNTYQDLYRRLIFKYFGGYYNKFEVDIFTFSKDGNPFKCNPYINIEGYNNLIEQYGEKAFSNNLHLIKHNQGNYSYISILDIQNNGDTLGTVTVNIIPKTLDSENAYSELLLEGKNKFIDQFIYSYDYAIYLNNTLNEQGGNFEYTTSFEKFNADSEIYNHYVLETGNKKVVVSSLKVTMFDNLSILFFILSFYLVLGLFIMIIYFILTAKKNYLVFNFSFRKKINIAMLSMVIISFLVIGMATIRHFSREYNVYHKKRLIRKQKAIISAINYLIDENKITNQLHLKKYLINNLNAEILKISDIHKIDMNVFDIEGKLIASSQNEIFINGLLSKMIHPKAFVLLQNEKRFQVVQDEYIGNLMYLAIYVPIINKKGEKIAYLNIPYFSKEKNLKDDISNFMISLINVYVLLFIIGIIVAFFISNSLTNSLKDISNKLKKISLNKKNESIKWETNDEIGTLVREYNKMILQLEQSANLLAKNERDEAWREMAKQIAHEIKNPLTPMKLSIQHLQRAINDDPVRAIDLAKRVTITLIEQINNLTDIATAFSSFAKMPLANKESFIFNEVLDATIDLFNRDSNIISKEYLVENANIYADKNQMISVFNNLIKNAIQATEEVENPKITVKIIEENNNFLVSVKDNGIGISVEKTKKVFVPNFTTKSSGTGLGLAISKQIIENLNGSIWFESEENKYTIFNVLIPKCD